MKSPHSEEPAAPAAAPSYTGGQIDEAAQRQYHALRAVLKAEKDVYDVLELSRRADGKWLYLVQTPLDWVFPKYVIGVTDVEAQSVELKFQCGALWSAQAAWDRIRHGRDLIEDDA